MTVVSRRWWRLGMTVLTGMLFGAVGYRLDPLVGALLLLAAVAFGLHLALF